MIIKYLLILGIGHLLGDFYFQNESMARRKDESYKGVLWHSIEYYVAILFTVLPVYSQDMILAATCMAFVHFVIDTIKYILLAKKRIRKNGRLFVLDQCAHMVSILILAYVMECWNFSIGRMEIVNRVLNTYGLDAATLARWIIVILFLHVPANIFIQNFLEDYKPRVDETVIQADHRAGRKIGTIERLIMVIFLSMNQYTAMGFVLTAKSIARYDRIVKDEKFAEYYLLGTLVSTLCVLGCGKLFLI